MKNILAALVFFVGLHANAGIITIDVSETQVSKGDVFTVSVFGTGFDLFDTLDFDLDFDTSLFSFDASSLMSDLSSAILFEANEVADGLAFSMLDFLPFSGDLLFASFELTATSDGAGNFSLSDALISDFLSGPLTVDASSTANVQVSAPATLGLLALTVFASLTLRRKV